MYIGDEDSFKKLIGALFENHNYKPTIVHMLSLNNFINDKQNFDLLCPQVDTYYKEICQDIEFNFFTLKEVHTYEFIFNVDEKEIIKLVLKKPQGKGSFYFENNFEVIYIKEDVILKKYIYSDNYMKEYLALYERVSSTITKVKTHKSLHYLYNGKKEGPYIKSTSRIISYRSKYKGDNETVVEEGIYYNGYREGEVFQYKINKHKSKRLINTTIYQEKEKLKSTIFHGQKDEIIAYVYEAKIKKDKIKFILVNKYGKYQSQYLINNNIVANNIKELIAKEIIDGGF